MAESLSNDSNRVRTLTGKEIELDIESDYKVRTPLKFVFTNRQETNGVLMLA